MSKIKVHELAKELNVDNKDIIDAAKKLKVAVTSHLNSIEDTDAKKIRDMLKNKEAKKENKREKDSIKTTGQVIIRREVIIEEEKKSNTSKENQKEGIGFNTQRRNKDFNIVYRERPSKPMTVSELFGIKPKKEVKQEEKKEEKVISKEAEMPKAVSSENKVVA